MNTGVQNPSPLGGMGVVVELHVALGISSGDVAAFVGAGGKFSAILAVCGGLTQEGMKVLVAPTTKMLLGEADRVGPLVTSEDASGLRAKTERALSRATAVVVGSGMLSKNRVGGVDPEWVGDLAGWPMWSWSRRMGRGGVRSKAPPTTSRPYLRPPPWS